MLDKYDVELIGASKEAIDKAEDRQQFDQVMKSIGLETPKSAIAHSLEEARQVQAVLGFPCVIRPSFTLGGSGGGVAYNQRISKQFVRAVWTCLQQRSFSLTSLFSAGKNLRWKSSATEMIIASSSVQ